MKQSWRKGLLFLGMAALLLCAALPALADSCGDGKHTIVYQTIQEPTCTQTGTRLRYCSVCGEQFGSETLGIVAHTPGAQVETVVKAPTCTGYGEKLVTVSCAVCGRKLTESTVAIKPTGHVWGEWSTVTAPQCEKVGLEARVCALDASHKEQRAIPALGHSWGEYAVTTAPTCTASGVGTALCQRDSGHTRTRAVAALGHQWGEYVITVAPTCTTAGEAVSICQHDSAHTARKNLAALGHQWSAWTVTVQPSCESAGSRYRVCAHDASHQETQALKATGHQHTHWVVIKEATFLEQGLRERYCDDCGKLLKTEKIPVKAYRNNTLCAFGPRLRDVDLYPYNTDLWYMFTPFDASRDGRQTYELVASNMYVAGTLTIDVQDGNVTVDYQVNGDNIQVTSEFFTILKTIGDLHTYEPENLSALAMRRRTPYSIENDFGGDTNLVLYFCSRVDYTIVRNVTRLSYESAAHRELLRNMLDIMDRP